MTGIRALAGYEPVWEWPVIITVAFLVCAPIGYLAGIGVFDYWVYYFMGKPTRPEDCISATARTAGATTSASTPTTR